MKFPEGTRIRIASRADLEKQRSEWKYHHPITDEHLRHAGSAYTVKRVGFYHGGDVLYTLENLPNLTWHEFSLEPVE
jgi:hypothetical protein